MNNIITAIELDTTAEIAINQIVEDYALPIARDQVYASLRAVTTTLQYPQSTRKELIKLWPKTTNQILSHLPYNKSQKGGKMDLQNIVLATKCDSYLISLGQLQKSRISFHDKPASMTFIKDGEIIAQAKRSQNVFILDLQQA